VLSACRDSRGSLIWDCWAEIIVLGGSEGCVGVNGSSEVDGDRSWEWSPARTTFAGVPLVNAPQIGRLATLIAEYKRWGVWPLVAWGCELELRLGEQAVLVVVVVIG
jgi:hypothetical protein